MHGEDKENKSSSAIPQTSIASSKSMKKRHFRFLTPPGKKRKKKEKTKTKTRGNKEKTKKNHKPSDKKRLKTVPISYEEFVDFHGIDSMPHR